MEVIFLGTTAAVPTASRNHPSIALKYHDEVILWDCGEGTQRQLIRTKTSFMKVRRIFITHFHGDHFLGLPGLIQTLSFSGRKEPLTVYGPPGVEGEVERVLAMGVYDLGFEVRTEELRNGFVLEEERYRIRAIRVHHSLPTFALVFEEIKGREFLPEKARALGLKPGPAYSKLQRGERVKFGDRWIEPEEVLGERKKGFRVVYTSDTRPSEVLLEHCRDSFLIHDGTFDDALLENAKETKHSTSREAALFAKRGKAKVLYLTHISPRYDTDESLLRQARKIFPASHVARDLLRVDLRTL
jgi:ribonuclease Z